MWWFRELGDFGFIFNIIIIIALLIMFRKWEKMVFGGSEVLLRPELRTPRGDMSTELRNNAHFSSGHLERLTPRRNSYCITLLGQKVISLGLLKLSHNKLTKINQEKEANVFINVQRREGDQEKHHKSLIQIIHKLT